MDFIDYLILFTLYSALAVAVILVAAVFVFALMLALSFTAYPLYCAPYWWYAGNKRCDGWYQSDGRIWTDIKKATYIYYCWITRRKTPED